MEDCGPRPWDCGRVAYLEDGCLRFLLHHAKAFVHGLHLCRPQATARYMINAVSTGLDMGDRQCAWLRMLIIFLLNKSYRGRRGGLLVEEGREKRGLRSGGSSGGAKHRRLVARLAVRTQHRHLHTMKRGRRPARESRWIGVAWRCETIRHVCRTLMVVLDCCTSLPRLCAANCCVSCEKRKVPPPRPAPEAPVSGCT